ncbi:MAG: FAD-binding oxidoreductase [Pseudomonadota bacterium]
MEPTSNDTIHLEQAQILDRQSYPADQFVLRLQAPLCANKAQPGSFVHVQCDPELPMRRPFSIMRSSVKQGWIEILFKVVGRGTRLLSLRRPGDYLSMLGPIGKPFQPEPQRPRGLLLGGGIGIPPMMFLAERMHQTDGFQALVLMGSEIPFPFKARPSQILIKGIPAGVVGAMPLLEDLGIASRLASLQDYSGCYQGYVTELAEHWIQDQGQENWRSIEIFACGPRAMLRATAKLARKYNLACQVALEEYMACAVGGCAGCVVRVKTDHGPAMKRVCVDGPVFRAAEIY